MKIYLAGPMRSKPHQNHPAFHAAAKTLRDRGHTVYSPAERDLAAGIDPTSPSGLDIRSALSEVITWILAHADAVVALPGWRASRGAQAEIAVAWAVDMPVWELADFLETAAEASRVQPAGVA